MSCPPDPAERLVGLDEPVVHSRDCHADGGMLEGGPEPLLAVSQGGFRLLAVGHVLDLRDEVQRLSVRITQEGGAHVRPDDVTVPAEVPLLEVVDVAFPRQQATHALPADGQVLRMGHRGEVPRRQFLLGVAQHVAQGDG